MKDVLALLLLLSVHTSQVGSQAYQADSRGKCRNSTTHFKLEETNLCCSKCKPGNRLKKPCTMDSDTVCEMCPRDQYLEQRNYSPNCFACSPCKPGNGLIYLQNCSTTTNSRCGCQPGTYCIMGFNTPYCELCRKYTTCGVGFGVSVPGTDDTNVKCKPCPSGTFSNTNSHTDQCQPHTNCAGRVVIRKGNAMADTECGQETLAPIINPQITTEKPANTVRLTTASASTMVTDLVPESTVNISPSISLQPRQAVSNQGDVSLPLWPVIGGAAGALILLTAAFALLCQWKMSRGKGAAKIDANGNCDTDDKMSEDYFKETQLISNTQEEERLLKEPEVCSNQSQSSNSTDLLTRSDDCSSFESTGPSQSTAALHGPHSVAMSEPMTLRSHAESVPSQTSVPMQPPSQPTSPHVISPITTSPHVNVNITFNIGNGSERTQCVTPTSLLQSDCQLPFGEKEETFSIPQQEAGKEAVVTVQESTIFCA